MVARNAPQSASWREPYQSTIFETNREKLADLATAEAAIALRRLELTSSEGDNKDRAAMVVAAEQLLRIKIYELVWISPKSNPASNPQPDVIEKVRRVESIHHWHR